MSDGMSGMDRRWSLDRVIKRLFPGKTLSQDPDSRLCIAVAAADHGDTLACVARAVHEGIADFRLFGDISRMQHLAESLGISLDVRGIEVIDIADHDAAAGAAADAVSQGSAQVLMKGAVHTSSFIRAILDKRRGLLEEGSLISHVARFAIPGFERPMLITDSAINVAPDIAAKSKILANAIVVARALGVEVPRVACVCPVETVNEKIPSTIDAAELSWLQMERKVFGEGFVEGPMGLDAALSRDAARVKGIEGEVPGAADILLLPSLDACNPVYKALSFFPDCLTAGIVTGVKVPVVLTSRSDSMETRLNSLVMALITAGALAQAGDPASAGCTIC